MPEPIEKRLVTEAKLNAELNPQSARLALLEGVAGFPAEPLSLEADVVRGLVSDPAGVVGKALKDTYGPINGSRPVGKGELVINAGDYGAVPSSSADQSFALNAAATAAFTAGTHAKLLIPRGNYRIDSTVIFRCSLDATEATFTYYGSGTAVVLGSDQAGIVTARQSFKAPRVIKAGRTNGWDGTSVGIQANNLNTCDIYVPFIQDFEQGLVMFGNSGGCAYSNVYLGALWENHKNLVVGCTPDGYSNQHQFFGGRLQQSPTKGAVLGDMNASQIYMVSENGEGGPNNNSFFGTSIEGYSVAYYRVDMSGRYNQFYNCRWEAPSGNIPRVRYRANATSNKIDGGYNSVRIVEVFDGTAGGGEIRDHNGAYVSTTCKSGQGIPNNAWTTINTWETPVSHRVAFDPATGIFTPRPGRWLLTATVTFAPGGTGRRIARLNRAGTVLDIAEAPGSATRTSLKLGSPVLFNGTQGFSIEVNQTSGAELALESSPAYVNVKAEYLGY